MPDGPQRYTTSSAYSSVEERGDYSIRSDNTYEVEVTINHDSSPPVISGNVTIEPTAVTPTNSLHGFE